MVTYTATNDIRCVESQERCDSLSVAVSSNAKRIPLQGAKSEVLAEPVAS